MENSTCYFDIIPDEIIVRILSLIDFKYLKLIKNQNRRLRSICEDNSKYLRKNDATFVITASKDDAGKPILDIETGEQRWKTEFSLRCTSTEISPILPYYLSREKNSETFLVDHRPSRIRYRKYYLGFLASVSKTIGDGRDLNLLPLQVSSLESGFQAALNFFLQRCEPETLFIKELRNLSQEEMNLILKVFKANRTMVGHISRTVDIIDDSFLELIKLTKCESLTFWSTNPNRDPNSEFSQRFLNLIKEWSKGNRKIRSLIYYSENSLDLFSLIDDDFTVSPAPPTMHTTSNSLHYCSIGREMDDDTLYLDISENCIAINKHTQTKSAITVMGSSDDDDDVLGNFFYE